MMQEPAAFLSYTHLDDHKGDVTQFRERLAWEVQIHTGEPFRIFQDLHDIPWGAEWERRVKECLDQVTFFIPILSPSFFSSPHCRAEVEWFLERQSPSQQNSLIFPVYYVECQDWAETDPLAQRLMSRQHVDWRHLRIEPITSPEVGHHMAELARQLRDACRTVRSGQPYPADIRPQDRALMASYSASGARRQPAGATSRRSEPATLVVNQLHRGEFLTISEAINSAEPGARILVYPGTYRECLVIEKPLEIIGQGPAGEVVVEAVSGNAISFKTSMSRVVNLTLRQKGGGEYYAVDIGQGRLELEDCEITSQTLSCVAIHGGADPRLRRNRIHGSASAGVFIFDGAEGSLEDNEIFDCRLSGVEIKTRANPVLRGNRIHNNAQAGVMITEGGCGTLVDNEISNNRLSGVEIRNGQPNIRQNRLHANLDGVFFRQRGMGTVEGNEIFGNLHCGIEIKEASNPDIRRNTISGRNPTGVYVHDHASGTLDGNEIVDCREAGILVQSDGSPTALRNTVSRNQHAVCVCEGGGGTFADNDLSRNALGAWSISPDSAPKVRRSRNVE